MICLSILIPTWNRLSLLKECLQSVLEQSSDRIEIVVSDNLSSDGTREYLKSLKAPNLQVVLRDENQGFSGNVNTLIERSSAPYFIILHDDDLLAKNAVRTIVDAIDGISEDCGLIVGGYELLDETASPAVRRVVEFPPGLYQPAGALEIFSVRWDLRAPAIIYSRKKAGSPFYTNEFGMARDSKVIFDYLLNFKTLILPDVLGVYRQTQLAETVSTISNEEWGKRTLQLLQYIYEKGREKGLKKQILCQLKRSLYVGWLKREWKKGIKSRNFKHALLFLSSWMVNHFRETPVTWRFGWAFKRRVIRLLTLRGGRGGRLLALHLFSNIHDPELISRSAQLLGLSGISLGPGVTVGQNSTLIAAQISGGGGLTIGSFAYIGKGVYISAGESVRIGSFTLVGANVQILGAGHRISYDLPFRTQPVVSYGEINIGNNVWIGNAAVILGRCEIGSGCVIGANSFVKNLSAPAFTMIVGNPGRILRQYSFVKQSWIPVEGGVVLSDEVRGISEKLSQAGCFKSIAVVDKISPDFSSGYTL